MPASVHHHQGYTETKFELLVGVCGSGVKGGFNLKKVGG